MYLAVVHTLRTYDIRRRTHVLSEAKPWREREAKQGKRTETAQGLLA